MTPDASLRNLWVTVAAGAWLFALFAGRLWSGATAGPWLPPAVLIIGLGWAAGRGPIAGAVLVGWAGALHAAATGGPVGVSVAAGAVLLAALRSCGLGPVRCWAVAGGLGWVWAVAVRMGEAVVGDGAAMPTDAELFAPAELAAAVVFGLLRAGVSATLAGDPPRDDRGWR